MVECGKYMSKQDMPHLPYFDPLHLTSFDLHSVEIKTYVWLDRF